MREQKHKHVLDGYRVLDFTQVLAGPTVTRCMAEMGAEIIKVEIAPGGDFSRQFPLVKNGRSGFFIQHNRGKKSLCVDVRNPHGLNLLKELVKKVDVVVENFSPGVIGRLGLGYDVIRELNPRAVMCSVSGYGQSGPLAGEPGYDYLGQAYAAVTYMIGEPDKTPILPTAAIGDVSTGVHAVAAIACALLYRDRTGQGQHVEVSILDTYFHYHEMSLQLLSASKGTIRPTRSGSRNPMYTPAGVFRGRQRFLVIGAPLDHQWRALCSVMGCPELGEDPRFATLPARNDHVVEVSEIIERWFASCGSDEEALAALREARIPHAPVLSLEEAIQHPHLRARETVRTIKDDIFGEFEAPGFPLRFSEFPGHLDLKAPALGEHNKEILTQVLGYSSEAVAALEREGVLRSADR